MENSPIKSKIITGVLWSSIEKGGVRGVNFIIGILIARILTPADYGLIGMIMVFITISNLFIDSGISQALVQKKYKSENDFSTAFIFNVAIAAICYIALYFLSPYISAFYSEPLLTKLIRILALNLILMALSTVPRAKLLTQLNFKKQAIANLSGVVIGGCVGLICAYQNLGVWSIIYQQLSCQLIISVCYWCLINWIPQFKFHYASFKSLWNYGVKLLSVGLLGVIAKELNSLVIGKIYRPSELGYYARAVQTSDMFAYTLNDMINTVTFPVLSSIQDEENKFNTIYLRMFEVTAYSVFPILTLLSAIAKPLFICLLTSKWMIAVPLFQWLCIARSFTPLTALNMNVLNAKGKPGLVLKLELLKMPIILILMIATLPISVKAVVIGNLISTIICFIINAAAIQKACNISLLQLLKLIYKIIITCSMMFIIVSAIMQLNLQNFTLILIGVTLGLLFYLFMSLILKINALYILINIIKQKLGNEN